MEATLPSQAASVVQAERPSMGSGLRPEWQILSLPHLFLTDADVGEYMTSSDLSTLSFSLFAYAKLGEDTYPSVVDRIGSLQGGIYSGGTSADFKNI